MSVQARPQDYARAIYELALETWTRQLGEVQRVLNEDAALRAIVEDPQIAISERLTRLEQTVSDGLAAGVRKFLGTLLEAGQIGQLEAILVELDRLVRRRPEIRLAHVTSAVPLTEAEQQELRAKLLRRFGADLDFQFEVDKSLIGGIRLRVGDQIIDGSIAGKLTALQDHLA